ncbi:MAG: bifunctional serine/threonine-protein kinase/formylglycine-generating enzyme family protein [Planctomycetota bacterium]
MSTEKIGGDFELDRAKLLGKGAWGDVFVGKQISLNRPVAIKLLKKELTADPDFVRRFRREAECLAKLSEEHIIQVYSAGEHQGSHYFIMEYVQGAPLSKLIAKKRKFSVEEITHVAVSVAKALKSAWSSPAQIVHRDIKPANIMVSFSSSIIAPSPQQDKSASLFITTLNLKDTQIKVMDFGLAKLVHEDQEATLVGTVIGTPKYISPEQGMGNPADIRSDIYSLGIVLYELSTGKIPFEGESAVSMIRHHIYDTALMISHEVAGFPVELEAIIMKCIQKAPNSRYINPLQLLEDLGAFEKSKPLIHAKADGSRVSSADATMLLSSSAIRVQQIKKRKIIVTGAVLSTLVIATALILWLTLGKKSSIGTSKIHSPPLIDNQTTLAQEDPRLKELYQKASELYRNNGFDESKKILDDILKKKADYNPAVQLLKLVQNEIDKRERICLSEAMKSETLKSIVLPKTKDHQKFNLILQNVQSKDYNAARRETDKLIEFEDDIIPPAATYFQMRIWNFSQENNYLIEMKRLYNSFGVLYPQSDCLPLAKKLYEDACISAESNSVDEIIADADKENNLQQRVELLKGFIKNNETNKSIQKIKDKLSSTYDKIERVRSENYKNTIAQSKEQARINDFKQVFSLLDKAREYTDDFYEIKQLKAEMEKALLQFYEIVPLTEERDVNTQSFLRIKNIKDASEMILIPAGEFIRGNDDGSANEKPAMMVNIEPYYVDKFETTNEQFKKFVEATKYLTEAEMAGFGWVYNDGILSQVKGAYWKDPKGNGKGITNILQHPIVQVSLKDAKSYATWARKRLITEAEWEKAARSNKQLIYPWGNNWINKSSNSGDDARATTPVGSYQQDKSLYGCYDIAGNVAEWCADYYDPLYYQSRITDNPKGPLSGECHVIRGGSWISSPTEARLTVRKGGLVLNPKNRTTTNQVWTNYLGFRCARDIILSR